MLRVLCVSKFAKFRIHEVIFNAMTRDLQESFTHNSSRPVQSNEADMSSFQGQDSQTFASSDESNQFTSCV